MEGEEVLPTISLAALLLVPLQDTVFSRRI